MSRTEWGRLQERRRIRIAGVMSGTSCDGITTTIVTVTKRDAGLRARVHSVRERAYSRKLRTELLAARTLDVPRLARLHVELGRAFGKQVTEHCRAVGVLRVDLVGCHGHTLFHRPRSARGVDAFRRIPPLSWQIGEAAETAERCGCPVVADFRPADVAAGGEGAPLVPFADAVLFPPRGVARVCLNIGGIANVTILSAEGEPRLAFDTGPGVTLIDRAARVFSGGKARMDRNGAMAARGSADKALLARLLAHPYFRQPPPKSTGPELFGEAFLARVLGRKLGPEDTLATVTELTVESIARGITALPEVFGDVVAAGGGIRNPTLLRLLRERLAPLQVSSSEEFGCPSEAREAAAFAILAAAFLWELPTTYPGTTGVQRSAVLGKLSLPPA